MTTIPVQADDTSSSYRPVLVGLPAPMRLPARDSR